MLSMWWKVNENTQFSNNLIASLFQSQFDKKCPQCYSCTGATKGKLIIQFIPVQTNSGLHVFFKNIWTKINLAGCAQDAQCLKLAWGTQKETWNLKYIKRWKRIFFLIENIFLTKIQVITVPWWILPRTVWNPFIYLINYIYCKGNFMPFLLDTFKFES